MREWHVTVQRYVTRPLEPEGKPLLEMLSLRCITDSLEKSVVWGFFFLCFNWNFWLSSQGIVKTPETSHVEYRATFEFVLVNKLCKNNTARKELWPLYSTMKEDLKKNWTLILGYEPDPVTQVRGFAYGLKLSLIMQQFPRNHPLKSQHRPVCTPGAQQAFAKQQKQELCWNCKSGKATRKTIRWTAKC